MDSKVIEVRTEKIDIQLSENEIKFFKNFLFNIDTIWHITDRKNEDFEIVNDLRDAMIAFKDRYIATKE